jgi:3-hydroxyacyl-CoA dehydrogenase
MGLVEFGVGVIPGGGGSEEMALRASDLFHKNDVELNVLQEYFLTIATKVSTSGYEALTADFTKGKDIIVVNKTVKLLKLRSMLY